MDKQDREVFDKSIKLLHGMTDILSVYFENWVQKNEGFFHNYQNFVTLLKNLRSELIIATKEGRDYRNYIALKEVVDQLLNVAQDVLTVVKTPMALSRSAKEMVEVCLRLAEIDRKYAEMIVNEDRDEILNKLTIEQIQQVMQWVRENDVDKQISKIEIN